MKIIWTYHAEERLKEWTVKFGIKKEEVENLVMNPEQIAPGHMDVLVAQGKMYNGLLRVPFKVVENDRKVLTIYWTSKIEKYWKEVKNEN
ncbi:MAG: DUF4258 domain-containing protein [Candidatus Aminicenantes bacterium]|nr:DUF4258 domain-containing protein [Candidatus Aminicenantes bacterium]